MPGFLVLTISQSLLKLMSVESVMPSNHLILCCLLFFLPSILPSIRVFSNELVLLIRWLNYWSFSLNISPSNEYSGLTYFKIDWLDLLAIQGTLKSLLHHHSSKASIRWCSAEIKILCYRTLYSIVQYTKAQPLVEDTHMWWCTSDTWTSLCNWTCKCTFASSNVRNLKVQM